MGDQVLKLVAQALQSSVCQIDVVAGYGGDELAKGKFTLRWLLPRRAPVLLAPRPAWEKVHYRVGALGMLPATALSV